MNRINKKCPRNKIEVQGCSIKGYFWSKRTILLLNILLYASLILSCKYLKLRHLGLILLVKLLEFPQFSKLTRLLSSGIMAIFPKAKIFILQSILQETYSILKPLNILENISLRCMLTFKMQAL